VGRDVEVFYSGSDSVPPDMPEQAFRTVDLSRPDFRKKSGFQTGGAFLSSTGISTHSVGTPNAAERRAADRYLGIDPILLANHLSRIEEEKTGKLPSPKLYRYGQGSIFSAQILEQL
jgi:hypothetical protein